MYLKSFKKSQGLVTFIVHIELAVGTAMHKSPHPSGLVPYISDVSEQGVNCFSWPGCTQVHQRRN